MIIIGMLLSPYVFFHVSKNSKDIARQYLNCINEAYPICDHPNFYVIEITNSDEEIIDLVEDFYAKDFKIMNKAKFGTDIDTYKEHKDNVLEIVDSILNYTEKLNILKRILLGSYKIGSPTLSDTDATYSLYNYDIPPIINSRQIYYLPCISIYNNAGNGRLFISYSALECFKNNYLICLCNPITKKLLHGFCEDKNIILINSIDNDGFWFEFAVYLSNFIIYFESKNKEFKEGIKAIKKKYNFALRKQTLNLKFTQKLTNVVDYSYSEVHSDNTCVIEYSLLINFLKEDFKISNMKYKNAIKDPGNDMFILEFEKYIKEELKKFATIINGKNVRIKKLKNDKISGILYDLEVIDSKK